MYKSEKLKPTLDFIERLKSIGSVVNHCGATWDSEFMPIALEVFYILSWWVLGKLSMNEKSSLIFWYTISKRIFLINSLEKYKCDN